MAISMLETDTETGRVYDFPVTIDIAPETKFEYLLHHVVNGDQLAACCDWLEARDFCLLDTETGGLDPAESGLATIQVGDPRGANPEAWVVDYRMFTRVQLDRFLRLIADPKRVKLGQNIKFECKFITYHTGVQLRNVWDTQVTEMVMRAGLFPTKKRSKHEQGEDESSRVVYSATSMDALCRRYLGIVIDKDHELRMSFFITTAGAYNRRQLVYSAGDVIYPYFIWQKQRAEIEARKLASVLKIEFGFVPVLAAAELKGIRLDVQQWRELWQEACTKRDDAERKLHLLLLGHDQHEIFDTKQTDKMLYPKSGKALNFDSPVQLKWALESYCRSIDWPYDLVTSEKAVQRMRLQYGQEYLRRRYERDVLKIPYKGRTEPDSVYAEREAATPFNLWCGTVLDYVPDHVIPDKFCMLESTDAPTLKLNKILGKLPAVFVDLLLDYAGYSIRADTFGNEFINQYVKSDGRIHTEFHQALTSTGRVSTTPNLQNIPKDPRYRACFIPAAGYKFVIADYSQQEPRLTAQETMDPIYLKTFANDEDIYLNTGEPMLGYRPDPTSPDPEVAAKGEQDRHIMKTIVLAMAYRMGIPKLWRSLTIALGKFIAEGTATIPTYEYVKGLHTAFLETFANLVEYQNKCSTLADPQNPNAPRIWDEYVQAPVTWSTARCGRKRFYRPDAKGTYTAAANAPIQGCAATMSKAAAVLIQRYIDEHQIDACLVDAVHDELVYECVESQAAEFALVVKELMEKAGNFWLPDVGIKAEFPKNTNGTVDFWTKQVKLELEEAA